MIKRVNFELNRPEGYSKGEAVSLVKIANKLYPLLWNAQKSFVHETLYLPKKSLEELCVVIVEFFEDVINDIGIWEALEAYNQLYFETPLPCVQSPKQNKTENYTHADRIRYLLWNKYHEFFDDLLLSPNHQDLLLFVEEISRFFMDDILHEFPDTSSLKSFFDLPNQYGWDVKKKLLWLGRHSYLFRHSFTNHMKENESPHQIQMMDDFVCQNATQWSGLGVADVLASLLNISEDQRENLRSWNLRHFSYYSVESKGNLVLTARNIINNKKYVIRAGEDSAPFKVGDTYIGSLVSWNDEWYWSGEQFAVGRLPQSDLETLRKEFLIKSPQIAYRYCDNLLKKAQNSLQQQYRSFVNFHGDDLAIFPDGYTMAAEVQKEHRLQYEAHPRDSIKAVKKKHHLKHSCPSFSYPREVLESENGIGLFFNPVEGQEIMLEFNSILSGMKKNGIQVTNEEKEAIRGFIQSPSISPEFVQKLAEKYGAKSVAESFLLGDIKDINVLQFVLRKYKGHGFRNRYPNISFV